MAYLIFYISLFFPQNAFAFNPVIFMDPNFQAFLVAYLPFVGGVLISVVEIVIYRLMFKQAYGWKQGLRVTLVQNVWALLLYVLLAIVAMNYASTPLMDTEHFEVVLIGMVYFGATFIYFSGVKKIQLVKKHIGEMKKALSINIFLINTVFYLAIYAYLYVRL